MSSFPGSPRILKGGIVLIDPDTTMVQRIITLQYNSDSLSRTLQVQGVGGESGDRLEALRLKAPAIETIKLDAEIDATDQLEFPDQNPDTLALGIYPQLAALEMLVYPSSAQLIANFVLSQIGTVEIIPMETPLALFVWSPARILPIRLTDFSITEEAFDPTLNPIRAKVSLGMRVLTVDDLGFEHVGGILFLTQLMQKEALATMNTIRAVTSLGLSGIP
jgi:hypothetical protein